MTMRTCKDFKNIETSPVNQYIIQNGGLKNVINQYQPPWFYFHSFIGILASQNKSNKDGKDEVKKFERVYLDNEEEGKLVLDVMDRDK